MVYFHIIYIEMQISFVVHVSSFLCLGRNFQTRSSSRSSDLILKGVIAFTVYRPFSCLNNFPLQFSPKWKSVQFIRISFMEILEDLVKYNSQFLVKWKTTENCTNINVLSFHKVKAKSLESLKLAHIV